MGGTQNVGEQSDNPVGINITAMVDIIFCLCLFFMCSLHFKQLEGKIETWLPKDRGNQQTPVPNPVMEEIRVFMRLDKNDRHLVRKVNNNPPAASDAELMDVIKSLAAAYTAKGKKEFPVLLDAVDDVPWADVMHVLDMCKAEKMARVEFAQPMPERPAK